MGRYRWIVFDADGTLFDYEHAERAALHSTFEHHGLDFDAVVHQAFIEINRGLWDEFEQGRVSSEHLRVRRFQALAERMGFAFEAADFSADYLERLGGQGALLPGASELVRELARDFGLVLATNGIADVQHSRFAASGLAPGFQGLVISDEIGVAKPDPTFFRVVFSTMDHPDRSEVLMVGDSLSSDIAGGENYGIDTCWFNPKRRPNDTSLSPTYEIHDLRDIHGILMDS